MDRVRFVRGFLDGRNELVPTGVRLRHWGKLRVALENSLKSFGAIGFTV